MCISCNKLHGYILDFQSLYSVVYQSITILTTFDMAANFTSKRDNRKLADLTRCQICDERFVEPRLLPCDHTYCFRCICTAALRTKGDFICPMMDGTTIQQSQINSLPANPAIVELIEMVSDVIIEDKTPPKNLPSTDTTLVIQPCFK
jgi:hypothetical protein